MMMTYAAVQMLLETLKQLVNCEDTPSINTPEIIREKPQFQLLYEQLGNPMIQTLLTHQHDPELQTVTKRFTDAADELQYLLDLFTSGVFMTSKGRCVLSAEDFNGSLNLDEFWRSFVEVELTSMRLDNMELGSSKRTLNQPPAAPQRELGDEFVVGIDGDIQRIREKLVDYERKVDVVSIVGMGGIGKTTLAAKVFNDRYIKYHFHAHVWVTVSQTYNKHDVLNQILKSIGGQLRPENDDSESGLFERVHKQLMGKRYLIVIDDIWHTETWDDLELLFPHDNNGSRVLLTTRITEVAKHANSDGLIHHVQCLSKETSWELLCQKVFHGKKCPEWSIKLGMQIIESCQGLPLAVAVIAGVLAKEPLSEQFWVEFAYKTRSYIVGEENRCLEVLGLSYSHLPLHLRECFLYLGGFPEDSRFDETNIWLWMAEGLIAQDGNRSLEDIAKGYLMDLIDRNLVIVRKRKRNGDVKTWVMHDLVRELCIRKAKQEGFLIHQSPNNITTASYKPARMFIDEALHLPYPPVKNLRAMTCWSESTYPSDYIAECFRSFVLLRVLDLRRCELIDFPEDIELLVHLRFLAIQMGPDCIPNDRNSSPSGPNSFPSSICKLWNLETLMYRAYYGDYDILPSNISDLVNLRHMLFVGNRFSLPSIERPMKLQTFSGVKLGGNLLQYFPCVKDLHFQTELNECYDLKYLTYLEKLKVYAYVGNHFAFPATLKTLELYGCGLAYNDMSIIQLFPNLQVLKLVNLIFEGSEWNTDENGFPQLKFLRLDNIDIKRWEAYGRCFMCLRTLEIDSCKFLEEIPPEIGEIPTLELIKIRECRPSVGECVRRIEEEQHDLDNYDLKIEVSWELSDK